MARHLSLLALTGALALTGCGGSSKSSSSASSSSAAAANNGSFGKITMKDIAFKPKQTTVKVGQRITWTNTEDVQHNVVANAGASFKSSLFGKGKTFSYTPKKPGKISYECTVHPGMNGTITVTK